ncbi:hypothetical protein M378DRAFT_21910 [Amanita muscaria Koide BX008]|uniref:Protein YOP1 n=1 Tax=Amanita muscaria (strain Koide BX008) TaxID=946122 RepID=A0A0C2TMI4_AMAMK|nr:hypothetical protein M378DRAFT_21910 [Amanita muscaria Koide BX008]
MLFFLTSRIVSSFGAFLYPGYASYKTLSQRPASEEDLERWLMYWSVLGCLVGVEYIAEWLISWIPFYYTFKSMFLLYLALPQTRGSSYIYTQHLQPFFKSHESQIDAALASLRVKVYSFVQERLRAVWDTVASAAGQQRTANATPDINAAAPSTLDSLASGPAQLVSSLWTSYGPGIVASGVALLRQAGAPTGNTRPEQPGNFHAAPPEPRPRTVRGESQQSLLEKRRRLEAELAALAEQAPEPVLTPSASSSRGSSDSDIRRRERRNSNASGGRFEEIEVPSDIEGYDVGQAGGSGVNPNPAQRASWFGWGGQKGDSERVKGD